MRVIGLDYGSVTCGVAISDETLLIASPVETIRYKTMDIKEVSQIVHTTFGWMEWMPFVNLAAVFILVIVLFMCIKDLKG